MPRRIALVLALVACGPSNPHRGGGDDAGTGAPDANNLPHTLTAIVVSPTNQIVQLDLGAGASQGYLATGRYLDGLDEDLTNQVTWAVQNPVVGSMTGSVLAIPAFSTTTVASSLVTASYQGFTGQAQITVAAYRKTGPQQDFFFILPYTDPSGPSTKPLQFATAIPSLDVFFLMDTTGSMAPEITNLQNALTGTVVPGIQGAVSDSEFGVGALEDFPVSPYGSAPASADCPGASNSNDEPFKLVTPMTSNVSAVSSGVAALKNGSSPIGCGNDWPEGGIEALYQVATGEGLSSPSPTNVPANHTGVGGVDYRATSMPVIVSITDAWTHTKNEGTNSCPDDPTYPSDYAGAVASAAHTRQATKDAIAGICGRVVGVAPQNGSSAGCEASEYLQDFATASGARVPPQAWDVPSRPANCAAGLCCTGVSGGGRGTDADGLCPLVFLTDGNGSGLGGNIVTGIQMLARFATFDVTSDRQGVTTDIDGNPLPGQHNTVDFIKSVTPTGFTVPPPPPTIPNPTFDATSFHDVTPGTKVDFDVQAFNDFVQQTATAQIFRATIRVLAGGCTPLDQRDVLILVPPTPLG